MNLKFKTISLILFLAGALTAKGADLSDCFSSRSTWYEAIQHGNCGYGQLMGQTGPGTLMIAAAATALYNGSYSCGECYQIYGPGGTGTVMIVDQCPDPGWCDTPFPHLDLSPTAFNATIGSSVGVAMTTVKKVSCDVTGPIKAYMKDAATTASWFEFMVFNHKVGIASISVEDQTGKITEVPRRLYNYWTYNGATATFPVIAHVYSIYGDQVDIYINAPTGATLYEGEGQFGDPKTSFNTDNCTAPFPVDADGWIFNNGLVKPLNYDHPNLGWADWSNGVTVNWEDSSTPGAEADSTACASGTLSGNNAIQIGTDLPVLWSGKFKSLEFYIKTDSPVSGNLIVEYGGGSGLQQKPSTTAAWTKFDYDLTADLGAPESLGKPTVLKFRNAGTSPIKVYLDKIRLVPV
ncbi:hypothetical protein DICPUDRAFT_55762 [Dictyostelium purpureum]|uniref:Expansin-like EG45 domain-containing protein n=1 Tax=Dictyostelium purpureum TaxID=5786 RepID=F0ZNH0_DICPU|nr:uncharacterized protein DICPUDRAFT_55762 [Dictyostelium purpureum]EGC34514.1 hypothetical protein DICPUDRAFT_55762 [Dictyostelium purpureum]|eukprot:XP_003288950.1 hypothetical protein DICPUDRAFT_55762 [Dictyostelium purpureum]